MERISGANLGRGGSHGGRESRAGGRGLKPGPGANLGPGGAHQRRSGTGARQPKLGRGGRHGANPGAARTQARQRPSAAAAEARRGGGHQGAAAMARREPRAWWGASSAPSAAQRQPSAARTLGVAKGASGTAAEPRARGGYQGAVEAPGHGSRAPAREAHQRRRGGDQRRGSRGSGAVEAPEARQPSLGRLEAPGRGGGTRARQETRREPRARFWARARRYYGASGAADPARTSGPERSSAAQQPKLGPDQGASGTRTRQPKLGPGAGTGAGSRASGGWRRHRSGRHSAARTSGAAGDTARTSGRWSASAARWKHQGTVEAPEHGSRSSGAADVARAQQQTRREPRAGGTNRRRGGAHPGAAAAPGRRESRARWSEGARGTAADSWGPWIGSRVGSSSGAEEEPQRGAHLGQAEAAAEPRAVGAATRAPQSMLGRGATRAAAEPQTRRAHQRRGGGTRAGRGSRRRARGSTRAQQAAEPRAVETTRARAGEARAPARTCPQLALTGTNLP